MPADSPPPWLIDRLEREKRERERRREQERPQLPLPEPPAVPSREPEHEQRRGVLIIPCWE